jgi:hypothetical protein
MNPDSDEDGLRDYLEIAGDKIQFNYQNDPSLSFTIQVQSDPKTNDTDLDGINDFIEHRDQLNPNSWDTNGDGIKDEEGPPHITEFTEEWSFPFATISDPKDLALDANGMLYVIQSDKLQRFDSQGILDNTYDTSYLQSPQTLTVLPNNDTLAITTSFSPGSSISVGNFLLHNKNSKSTGSSALMTGHSPPMDFDDAGDTMVVGDPGRNVAWVAEKTGGVWRFTSQLYDPEIERYQDGNARHTWFGTSVAIDGYGNTVVVGSPGMNLGNPKPGSKNYPQRRRRVEI